MIQLEETSSGVRALDHANVEVAVGAPDWATRDRDGEIPRPTDTVVHGHASELRFPAAYVSAYGQRRDRSYELGSDTGPLELPDDSYLLDVGTGIKSYVSFEGPATLVKSEDFETLTIAFPERRPVALGFRSRHEHPAGTITAEATPEGVATALTHLHSAMKTTSPDRSFPTLRGHPPRLELGAETGVPDHVAETTEDTGVELVVPPRLATLYVVAPLAYYLQASVRVESGLDGPQLRAPAAGVDVDLPALPELQARTADLLAHVFYLDCLVRNVGPYGTDLAEAAALDDVDLDPEAAYRADPPERLAAYRSVPTDALDDHTPEWHLSTYVEPEPGRAPSLPFLLDRMSMVYLPQTSELSGEELLERSLDDFYRGGTPRADGAPAGAAPGGQASVRGGATRAARASEEVASVDVVKPTLQAGRVHAWLADGIPIDVFKASQAAFENRLDYLDRETDGIDVAVVLNDEEMKGEHGEVARIYRERAEELPMDVTVHEYLTREELAALFAEDNDFLHYIGHCETTGLRCADGNLGAADVEESNAQTFFLNACGSYYEGMELIERGAVAGAVTFKEVLNRQAAKVGTTFAQLLTRGFSFVRAMQLARRRIMTGKDYAVVGDGTHTLTQSHSGMPVAFGVEESGGGYRLTADNFSARTNGAVYAITLEGVDTPMHLAGNESRYELSAEQLLRFVEQSHNPFVFDGDLYWRGEIEERLD
jgi:hypothetical protein